MYVASLQTGRARAYADAANGSNHDSQVWRSGIVKSMVLGPVRLNELGFAGDEQADHRHHGGPDKAVLAYSAETYARWQDELGQTLPAGAFGENITASGLTEQTVCIGDCFEIGSTILEVSQTRIPCWKINRRWRREDLLERVRETGRTGWYLRVRQTGSVEAGDAISLLERPNPTWSIARVNDVIHGRLMEADAWQALTQLPQLAASQRDIIQSKLRKAT